MMQEKDIYLINWYVIFKFMRKTVLSMILIAVLQVSVLANNLNSLDAVKSLRSQLESSIEEFQKNEVFLQGVAAQELNYQTEMSIISIKRQTAQSRLRELNEADLKDPGASNPLRLQSLKDQIAESNQATATLQAKLRGLDTREQRNAARERLIENVLSLRRIYEQQIISQSEQRATQDVNLWQKEVKEVIGRGEVRCSSNTNDCQAQAKQAALVQASEQGSRIFIDASMRSFESERSTGGKSSSTQIWSASTQVTTRVRAELSNLKEINQELLPNGNWLYIVSATAKPSLDASLRQELVHSYRRDLEGFLGGPVAYPEGLSVRTPPPKPIIIPRPNNNNEGAQRPSSTPSSTPWYKQ
jgi:hypothetical protein